LEDAQLALPYPIGGAAIAQLWNAHGRDAVDALFERPPRALVDWLVERGLTKPQASALELLDCAPPRAPDGYAVYAVDSWGATGAFALLAAANELEPQTPAALRADAIVAYVPADMGSTAATRVAWRLRFSNRAFATTVEQYVQALGFTTRVFD